jgi:glutamate formiminotransferase/formiminotetrahydrofolate cyclodeaminase
VLIECVPNYSEGRDPAIIDAITNSIKSVDDVSILDVDMGYDFNKEGDG